MNEHGYDNIGETDKSIDSEYIQISEKGKPQHTKFDDFYRKHPFMDVGKRAKIFAPFAALRGFDGCILDKEVQYQPKIILDEEVTDEIAQQLEVLHRLTINCRIARKNHVVVSVTYFIPCSDKHHEAYGYRGQYVTVTGVCKKVDSVITKAIIVEKVAIPLDDIYKIEYIEE